MPIPALQVLPIRLRLALGYTLLLLAIIGVVGLFLLTALETNLEQDAEIALRLRLARVQREIQPDPRETLNPAAAAAALADLGPLEEFSAPGIYVQVLDKEQRVVASSANLKEGELPIPADVIAAAMAGREASATVPAGQERIRVLARPIRNRSGVVGVVVVGESLHLLDLTMRRMQGLLVFALGLAALGALVGGWWLTTRALGPVGEVTQVARRIAATGRFEKRIEVPAARDELGELVVTINEMLDRIQESFFRQREFIGDVSHELRGPLGVVSGNLDLLQLDLPREEHKQSAREAALEARHMRRLVADLLFLAEVDGSVTGAREPVALDEVVAEVFARAERLDSGSHELTLAANELSMVLGDRERLRQLVSNLVENALRYTPTGGAVVVSLRHRRKEVELDVSDTGTGIDKEHLPRVFDRFFRVDKARTRSHESTGLGLAIVKHVAESHGGQVEVRSLPNEGSTFTVTLPHLR